MTGKDDDIFTGDDDLASFLNQDDNSNQNKEEEDLFAFLSGEKEENPLGNDAEPSEDDLFAFLADDDDDEEDDDDEDTSLVGNIIGASKKKPEPIMPFKHEKRKARLDITKNSKEDHRTIQRYTKKELQDQLIKDYRYMMGKSYMMIQPVTIMADYPYKKKKSDSDIMNDHNVDKDYVLVIGKLLKWRGTEEFRGKPYKLGYIMYVRRGDYWVNGQIVSMEPHFAIVLHKSYKRIKSKRIRDLLKPLKQRLRSGKPFTIYKEFPIIVKRTGVYS